MSNLRLHHTFITVVTLGLAIVLNWQSVTFRIWLSAGLTEFNKSITSAQIEICQGQPDSLDRAENLTKYSLQIKEDPAAYDLLGKINLWRGNLEEAAVAWEHTNYPIAHFITDARHHQQQGRNHCAIEQYKVLNSLWPDSSLPWFYMGDALRKSQLHPDALEAYNEAARLNNFAGGNVRLGDVYLQKGEVLRDRRSVADAYEAYSLSIDVGEFSAPFYAAMASYKKGEMLVWMRLHTEAIEPLQSAILIAPDFYNAFTLLGFIYIQERDYLQAQKFLLESLDLEPNYIWTHLYLADVYVSMEDVNAATIHYQHALGLDPQNEQALRALQQLNLTE